MKPRQLALGLALAATLAATWWAAGVDTGEEIADTPRPAARPIASPRSAPAEPSADLAALAASREAFAMATPPLFGLPPPPPPPPRVREPAAERAAAIAAARAARPPALPYSYVGSLQEEGAARLVFLLRGDELVTARVGQVFDTHYRIESVDKEAVELMYLPLGQIQRIELADRS